MELRRRGLSVDQIVNFERGGLPQPQKPQIQEKPQYKGFGESIVNFGKDIAQGAYLALGGQKTVDKLTQQYLDNGDRLFQMAQKQTDPGKKRQFLIQAQQMYSDAENIRDGIIGKVRTNKQIIADALGTLGYASLGGVAPGGVAGRLGFGTVVGAGAGAQQALKDDKSKLEIAKSTAIGGAVGLGVGVAAEGIGFAIKKLVQTNPVQKLVGNVFNRELKPPTREIVSDLERHAKTLGERVVSETDELGKPIYQGGYSKMAKQAETQISKNAELIKQELLNAQRVGAKVKTSAGERFIHSSEIKHAISDLNSLDKSNSPIVNKLLNDKSLINGKFGNFNDLKNAILKKLTPLEQKALTTPLGKTYPGGHLQRVFDTKQAYMKPEFYKGIPGGDLSYKFFETLPKNVKSNNFRQPLLEKLTDDFGLLDERQLATVEAELKKLPPKMNILDALKNRQIIDSKIPKGFWIDPNPQKAFIGNVRYYLRGLMKDAIEQAAPSAPIKQLNQKIGLAMDVKDLSYLQEALRAKGQGVSSIGFWKPISLILDKTLFNPSITTRVAQGISRAGQFNYPTTARMVGTIMGTKANPNRQKESPQ